jgi:hypothetical protein
VSGEEEANYVEAARREHRTALEAMGVPAFAYRYERSHLAVEALGLYRDEMGEAGPRVRMPPRVEAGIEDARDVVALGFSDLPVIILTGYLPDRLCLKDSGRNNEQQRHCREYRFFHRKLPE